MNIRPPRELFEPLPEENEDEQFLASAHRRIARRKEAKRRGISTASMRNALVTVEAMIAADDYTGATPIHFVAMYAKGHSLVYGVPAAELGPQERTIAVVKVARFLRSECGGDVTKAAAFLRWVWRRESEREKWRRENNKSGGTLGWGLVFSAEFATQWRVDMERMKAKDRRR